MTSTAATEAHPRTDSGRVNLLGLDAAGLDGLLQELNEKPFRSKQLRQWLHQRRVFDFDAMTDLAKGFRSKLVDLAELRVPTPIFDRESNDGTRKWLLALEGGQAVETVYIPERGRGTLCVSSQVGCALDCGFCSTGKQGFNRNLTAAEIIGQLHYATQALEDEGRDRRVTNVVMMGMGEPLANFRNVVAATNLMVDPYAWGLSRRRVTLSTVGLVPALYRLRDVSNISLAVSLHAPNDALRDEIVPINRKYPLRELLPACEHYLGNTPHHCIYWEYVMLDGVNDSDAQARELAALLRDIPSKINLIPFNPFPGTRYEASPRERIQRFADILQNAGFITTTRRTRGQDIDGACGQLVGQVINRRNQGKRGTQSATA
ncbi:23S rRNA (adenine(2503)-C(2))-methyltransferase RlmN [Spiribacter vilamensis]|uniref:Dual-specificity RNA methyltransferase RlmN n=1 Tax=Spiribacter vilamensis TaxID=531306 RepID=A0A4V2GJ47_9GAMM|nr:23S rRNA (adenine(2503)-C(2))-methyltransferase RlmN [Spiribacter vilamensis]RZU98895.1 23S rRNA m(2)A-2503 methyltransferase [Spiribacter vilamensis]TVO62091.1 23S rRNA (adenine(2503)-C(2))-methyltransferase RlmN [Spiribacter vilamensis]